MSHINASCLYKAVIDRYKAARQTLCIFLCSMKKQQLIPVVAHAAGWLLFFSLVAGFISGTDMGHSATHTIFSGPFLLFCFIFLSLFYVNTYLLIPRLYLRRKYIWYIAVIVLLFAVVYYVKPFDDLIGQLRGTLSERPEHPQSSPPPAFDHRPLPPPPGDRPMPMARPIPGQEKVNTDIVSVILFITVWSLSTALCIIGRWRTTEQRVVQAEADKAQAELSFLKAQINPHFLFNTLNNIYSLAISRSDLTALSILKLSNIMRHVTDEVTADKVRLDAELSFIRDYIDLQKLRLGQHTTVYFIIEGEAGDKMIAPLILVPFIENVFKYGVSNHEPAPISIRISMANDRIDFFASNKVVATGVRSERAGGIGISNTKQRLKHLYPEKHTLHISREEGFFTVQLSLSV